MGGRSRTPPAAYGERGQWREARPGFLVRSERPPHRADRGAERWGGPPRLPIPGAEWSGVSRTQLTLRSPLPLAPAEGGPEGELVPRWVGSQPDPPVKTEACHRLDLGAAIDATTGHGGPEATTGGSILSRLRAPEPAPNIPSQSSHCLFPGIYRFNDLNAANPSLSFALLFDRLQSRGLNGGPLHSFIHPHPPLLLCKRMTGWRIQASF